jgi:4-diphosphocytidyl-2-C-methyl-D-erythritol kinase
LTALSLEAPAKLNLSLHVVGRRADGFHLLETEMVLLELADRLLLLPGATGLRVEAPSEDEIPVDRGNLAWRGLVAGLGGEPELACLTLEKRATADELADLALIGADVPLFAARVAAARVTGIGEMVIPQGAPPEDYAVLVLPPFRLSTAAVFGELRPSDLGSDSQGNDLLAPALRLRPALNDVLRQVAEAGGEARLTGSGSTVFTLTADPERANTVAERLRAAGLQVLGTRLRRAPAEIVELGEAALDAGASAPRMGPGAPAAAGHSWPRCSR